MSERATEPSPVSPAQGDRPQPAVPPPPPTHPPMPGRENGANGSSGDTAARGVPSANGKPDSKPDAKPDAGDTQGAGIPPAPKQPPPSTPPPTTPPPTHPAPARPPGDQDRGNPTPPAKPAPTPEPQSKTDTAAVPRVSAAGAAGTAGGTSTTTSITDKPAPAPRGRAPRRARLRMTRIDPWSVMKTAFLLSIAFAVVTVVAVAMVWQVLGAAGVWESINSTIQESIGGDDVASFQVQDYLGTSRVLGFTMLVAAIDVVLLTAAATLTAFLYNMAAALLGGIEVTLAEDQD